MQRSTSMRSQHLLQLIKKNWRYDLKVGQRDAYEKTESFHKLLHELLVKWINKGDQMQCTPKKGDQNIYHLRKSYINSSFYNQLAGL